AAPHDPVHRHRVHDRRDAALRRTAAVQHQPDPDHGRFAAPVPDAGALHVRPVLAELQVWLRRGHLVGDVRRDPRDRRRQLRAGPPAAGSGRVMTTSALTGPAALRAVPARRGGSATKQLSAGWGTYVLLGTILLISVFPLYWTLVAASQDNAAISKAPPTLLPGSDLLDNVRKAFTETDMRLALINSTIVAGTVTFSVVLTSTL